LNDNAPPFLPATHDPLAAVPALPEPDESATTVPDVSLNAYAATNPAGAAPPVTAALAWFDAALAFPAASSAFTWK
jgi:hypothetical protein